MSVRTTVYVVLVMVLVFLVVEGIAMSTWLLTQASDMAVLAGAVLLFVSVSVPTLVGVYATVWLVKGRAV